MVTEDAVLLGFASAEATGDVAGFHKLLKKLDQNFT